MKRLKHRCDVCFYKNQKCNREAPKCAYCLKNNLECDIKRTVKKSNKNYSYEDSISIFKMDSFQSNINKGYRYEDNIGSFKANPFRYNSNHPPRKDEYEKRREKISQKPAALVKELTSTTSKAASAILLVIPTKELRNNILHILQYPNVNTFSINMKLMISISTRASIIAGHIHKKEFSPIEYTNGGYVNLLDIMVRAFQRYFRYEHTILPVFDISQFDFNNCDVYLKLVIIASGLLKLPKDNTISHLLKCIEIILYKQYKYIYRMKPRISIMQAVVLILTGLKEFKWVMRTIKYFIHYLMSSAHSLGIHRTPIKSKTYRQNKYLYNAANFVISYYSFASYTLYPPVYMLLINLGSKEKFKSRTSYINYLNEAFSNILLDCSYYFYKLTIIKVKIAEGISTYSGEENKIFNLVKLYKQRYLNQLSTLCRIEYMDTEYKDVNMINVYKVYAAIFYNFFKFSSLSFSLYHSTTEAPFLTIEPIFTSAIECISYLINLSLIYHTPNTISILLQCLLFSARYKKYNDFQMIWYKGLYILKALTGDPFNSFSANFNYQLLLETIKLV